MPRNRDAGQMAVVEASEVSIVSFVSKGSRQMFRTRIVALLCVIALVVATIPASAHDVYRFVGPIVKWDAAKNTLDITTPDTGKKVLHIVLREDATVTRSGRKVPRSELKPGRHVIVDAVGVDLDDIEGTEIQIYPEK
jgi:hypothetical protein